MPLPQWPAADRQLWEAACRPGGYFEDGGALADLRPRSRDKIAKGYGRWLTYLSVAGQLSEDPPATRITAERVRAYVEHLTGLGNATQTNRCRLQELGDMARVLGPGRAWSFIARQASRIRARQKPARAKRARLVGSERRSRVCS
jgi:hypothetical protein